MQFVFSRGVSKGKNAKVGGYGENRRNMRRNQGVEGMNTTEEEGKRVETRFALSGRGSECGPFSQNVFSDSKSSLSNIEREVC